MSLALPATPASMRFIADLPKYETEKPYNCRGKDVANGEISNLVFDTRSDIPVHDVRGHEHEFSLQKQGFMFVNHESKVRKDIGSVDFVYEYLGETINLVKQKLNAEKVVCYDLRIRRNIPKEEVTGNKDDRSTAMFTVEDVHVDQTVNGGYQRIKRHIREDEVNDLDMSEWQALIVNVWRPLRHQVEDAPLAFCDFESVEWRDLIEADRVYETYCGEIYYMKYSPGQKWYYLSKQKPDEVAIFMSFISDPGHYAKFCPHVSFKEPNPAPDCHKRESVEVRAIALRRKVDI